MAEHKPIIARQRTYVGGMINRVCLRRSYIILNILQHVINFTEIYEKGLCEIGLNMDARQVFDDLDHRITIMTKGSDPSMPIDQFKS